MVDADQSQERSEGVTPQLVSGGGFFESAVIIAIAFVPRFLSLLTSKLWFEDSAYLHHALLITLGEQPFVDFPQAHFPLPEYLLAFWYTVVGASVRSTELFSCVVMGCATVVTANIARRLSGGWLAGIAAAVVVAGAPILNQYHIYAREALVWLLLTVFVAVSIGEDRSIGLRSPKTAGMFIVLALACKLTAVLYFAPLVLMMLWDSNNRRAVLRWMAAIVAFGVIGTAYFAVSYGDALYQQMIGLHFLKGANTTVAWAGSVVLGQYGHVVPIMVVAAILLSIGRRRLAPAFVVLTPALVFFVFVSPTVWDHNLLPWLLPIGLMAGGVAAELQKWIQSRKSVVPTGSAVAVLAVVSLVASAALYGLVRWPGNGIDRKELTAAAETVASATGSADRIHAPAYAAFAAHRRLMVPYQEVAGLVRLQEENSGSGAWYSIGERLEGKSWLQRYSELSTTWAPDIQRGLETHVIGAVVRAPQTPEWIDPFDRDDLLVFGYEPVFAGASLEVFLPRTR